MEIGHHTLNDAELIATRRDHNLRRGLQAVEPLALHISDQRVEQLRATHLGRYVVQLPLTYGAFAIGCATALYAVAKSRNRLQRAHRRCAHGNDSTVLAAQVAKRRQAHLEMLGMHRVVGGVLLLDGQERTRTHVQCNLLKLNALALQLLDQFRGEVQTRSRSRHRALETRIDGLVAGVVDLLALATQVGRNGNSTQLFEQLPERERCLPTETDNALTTLILNSFGNQTRGLTLVFEVDQQLALLPLFRVADNAAPLALAPHRKGTFVVGGRVGFEAENLDTGTRRFVHHDTGADHLGVVEDQHRPLGQHLANAIESALGDVARTIDQQFRLLALVERELCDSLVGQVVGVVVNIYLKSTHFRN